MSAIVSLLTYATWTVTDTLHQTAITLHILCYTINGMSLHLNKYTVKDEIFK